MSSKTRRNWTAGILGAVVFSGIVASTEDAQAAVACGPREQVVKMLQTQHDEVPVSMGLAVNGAVVEVFSRADGSSWTLVMTRPDGNSCLMASGESWMSVTKVAAGQIS